MTRSLLALSLVAVAAAHALAGGAPRARAVPRDTAAPMADEVAPAVADAIAPAVGPVAPSLDAVPLQQSSCGDSRCSPPEDCNTCPEDCGRCCGDRRCAPPEDCHSCPADCGPC